MARLRWSGNRQAQRIADEAYRKLHPRKRRRKRRHKPTTNIRVDDITKDFIKLVKSF